MKIIDLDKALMRLGQVPLPAGLAQIDEGVFARLALADAYRARHGFGIAAITAALLMGIVSAAIPPREAAVNSLAPLGLMSPLSPAVLLGGEK